MPAALPPRLLGRRALLAAGVATVATGGLPFPELRKKALINAAAQAADKSPDFSRLIREGLPGFTAPQGSAGDDRQ